ncbi:SirB1 family protein [Stella sp.]|uniref:SirB1 family protein n=1 Tax=Stella sp. TaxID=2912054 RepID=UPI0035AFA861
MTAAEARARLRSLAAVADAEFPLGEAALALAAIDRPQVPLDRYRAHLDELALAVAPAGGDAAERAAALATAIAVRHRYQGDVLTYDDLQNANLIRVVDRRKGLPVALGILYLETAQRVGWPADGLAFPGHFVIAVAGERGRAVVDPFHGGRICDAAELRRLLKAMAGADQELQPEHYAPVARRSVLLRLHNNVKLRRMQGGDAAGALAALEAMLLFAPDEGGLWHEAGLLHAHLGNLRAALDALAAALDRTADSGARHRLAAQMQALRQRLH